MRPVARFLEILHHAWYRRLDAELPCEIAKTDKAPALMRSWQIARRSGPGIKEGSTRSSRRCTPRGRW